MTADIILFAAAAALLVVASITYSYFPSKKIKPWLCSILWRAACVPMKVERAAAAAAAEGKQKKAVAAMAVSSAELERVFATFDKNGDGYITVAELEESLRRLGLSTTSEEVASMVEKLDANGDGLLDLEEFRELYNSVGGGTAAEEEEPEDDGAGGGRSVMIEGEGEVEEAERELKEAFDVFDSNSDGVITVEELGMVLVALGLAPGTTAASCREMIKKVDIDGDGKVSFEEFKQMMKGAKSRKLL